MGDVVLVTASATGWGGVTSAVPLNHRSPSSRSQRAPQDPSSREQLKDFGHALFDMAIRGSHEVEKLWQRFAEPLGRERDEARPILTCEAEALANLPWECLFDGANLGFVAFRIHFWRALRCAEGATVRLVHSR